mgnify:CR=1 FL=1
MENFAQLAVDIFEGKAGKKVLFQPRINCWYDDKLFLHQPLPGGLDGMSKPEMYRALGVSNRLYEYNACFERTYDKSVRPIWEELGGGEYKQGFSTPLGEIYAILRSNTSNPGMYYKKWLVETPEDIRIATYVEEASDYRYNPSTYDALQKEWGDNGEPTMFICRTGIQECFVTSMGVENTIYALLDERALMEKYFDAIEKGQQPLLREIVKSPLRVINYGDNLHGGITSPELYERYVIPVYARRYEILHPAGKFVHSHWDGDVAALLPFAQKSYLDGIEALTPEPQGDVTVEQIYEALGEKQVLLDGIAAILFHDNYPEEQLLAQAEQLIKLFAGRLILGISDEMSSFGNIERVRLVRNYVNRYNASLEKNG